METCSKLTRDQLDEILLGDDGTTLPLLQERYLCLQQSANNLLIKYKGTYVIQINFIYNFLYYYADLIFVSFNLYLLY